MPFRVKKWIDVTFGNTYVFIGVIGVILIYLKQLEPPVLEDYQCTIERRDIRKDYGRCQLVVDNCLARKNDIRSPGRAYLYALSADKKNAREEFCKTLLASCQAESIKLFGDASTMDCNHKK